MFLLDDILLAPARGLFFIFREIHKQVMAEYYNEEVIYNKLRRLQYQFEIGEISASTFNKLQNALVRRLKEIAQYEEQLPEEEADEETNG